VDDTDSVAADSAAAPPAALIAEQEATGLLRSQKRKSCHHWDKKADGQLRQTIPRGVAFERCPICGSRMI
jgi:hypothetical protein